MEPTLTNSDVGPDDLDSIYARSPDDPDVLYQLGLDFYQARRMDEAENIFRRMVILSPKSAKGYATLGVISWNRGDFEEAFDLFSRALDLDSSDPDTLVNLGLISEQLGETELAISLLQSYLVLCPGDHQIKDRLEALRCRNGVSTDTKSSVKTIHS
jgi:Flp pilus assembly protein TadD